jgi:thioredoxin 1
MSEYTFEVTDANFQNEVIKSGVPVLVDFWAEWCGPCKMVEPIVEELAKKYAGKLRVGKLDIESQPNVPQLFGIQGIPTLILFKNGEPVQQIVGFRGKEQMDAAISKHLALENA